VVLPYVDAGGQAPVHRLPCCGPGGSIDIDEPQVWTWDGDRERPSFIEHIVVRGPPGFRGVACLPGTQENEHVLWSGMLVNGTLI